MEYRQGLRIPYYPIHKKYLAHEVAWKYIEKFHALHKETDWYHVMISRAAIPSLMKALEDDEEIYQLPFWCWCDGGSSRLEKEYREHIHAILIFSSGRSVSWPKIDGPCRHYVAVKYKKLETVIDLGSALKDLTEIFKSTCHFSLDYPVKRRFNRIYVYVPTIKCRRDENNEDTDDEDIY